MWIEWVHMTEAEGSTLSCQWFPWAPVAWGLPPTTARAWEVHIWTLQNPSSMSSAQFSSLPPQDQCSANALTVNVLTQERMCPDPEPQWDLSKGRETLLDCPSRQGAGVACDDQIQACCSPKCSLCKVEIQIPRMILHYQTGPPLLSSLRDVSLLKSNWEVLKCLFIHVYMLWR